MGFINSLLSRWRRKSGDDYGWSDEGRPPPLYAVEGGANDGEGNGKPTSKSTSTSTRKSTNKSTNKSASAPATIDEYFASVSSDKRVALQRLRRDIRAAAPGADECISYGMPAFRLDGRMLAWFGAGANHCAFYPGAIVQAFEVELKRYTTSKGTIRFQPDSPLSGSLVRKLVRACIARNAARTRLGP